MSNFESNPILLLQKIVEEVGPGAGARFSGMTPETLNNMDIASRGRLAIEVSSSLLEVSHQQKLIEGLQKMISLSNAKNAVLASATSSLSSCTTDEEKEAKRKQTLEELTASSQEIKEMHSQILQLYNKSVSCSINEQLQGDNAGRGINFIKKRRRNFSKGTTDVLKAWFYEHILQPYPDDFEKKKLAAQTDLSMSQVSYWFVNARKRIWQPLLKTQKQVQDSEGAMGENEHMMEASPTRNAIQSLNNPVHPDDVAANDTNTATAADTTTTTTTATTGDAKESADKRQRTA